MLAVIVSKLFQAYGLYNEVFTYAGYEWIKLFQSSFELTGYITNKSEKAIKTAPSFKALSSLRGT